MNGPNPERRQLTSHINDSSQEAALQWREAYLQTRILSPGSVSHLLLCWLHSQTDFPSEVAGWQPGIPGLHSHTCRPKEFKCKARARLSRSIPEMHTQVLDRSPWPRGYYTFPQISLIRQVTYGTWLVSALFESCQPRTE